MIQLEGPVRLSRLSMYGAEPYVTQSGVTPQSNKTRRSRVGALADLSNSVTLSVARRSEHLLMPFRPGLVLAPVTDGMGLPN